MNGSKTNCGPLEDCMMRTTLVIHPCDAVDFIIFTSGHFECIYDYWEHVALKRSHKVNMQPLPEDKSRDRVGPLEDCSYKFLTTEATF